MTATYSSDPFSFWMAMAPSAVASLPHVAPARTLPEPTNRAPPRFSADPDHDLARAALPHRTGRQTSQPRTTTRRQATGGTQMQHFVSATDNTINSANPD